MKRIGVLIGVPVAVVLGLNAFASAGAALKSWNSGDTLTAADLNANFNALNSAFVDLTSDQTIAGTKTFIGVADVGYQVSLVVVPDGVAGSVCARVTGQPVGVFDCTCPAGSVAISGGANCNLGTEQLKENRPIDAHTWRVACTNSTGALTDPHDLSLGCARLGK